MTEIEESIKNLQETVKSLREEVKSLKESVEKVDEANQEGLRLCFWSIFVLVRNS